MADKRIFRDLIQRYKRAHGEHTRHPEASLAAMGCLNALSPRLGWDKLGTYKKLSLGAVALSIAMAVYKETQLWVPGTQSTPSLTENVTKNPVDIWVWERYHEYLMYNIYRSEFILKRLSELEDSVKPHDNPHVVSENISFFYLYNHYKDVFEEKKHNTLGTMYLQVIREAQWFATEWLKHYQSTRTELEFKYKPKTVYESQDLRTRYNKLTSLIEAGR